MATKPTQSTEEHTHQHSHGGAESIFKRGLVSFVLLISALLLEYILQPEWFAGWIKITWYILAYLPVGLPVLKEALLSIRHGDVFSEFFLMGIATLGAFAIEQYPEAVAVMLFYYIGEGFQTMAIERGKKSIQKLIDQRPDEVLLIENNLTKTTKAEDVEIGSVIRLKPGDKLALDGKLKSEKASFNTSALTGESYPVAKSFGEEVLAGMINLNTVAEVEVTQNYQNSKLSKIIDLIQNAAQQKAPTELFIRKFAKIYTPIVVFLAVAIALLPYFFVQNYVFSNWLYRSLVFLVISCPCALVISIPLGYFGGIGAASKKGILLKGGNFLDALSKIEYVVMDKTGTLTEGIFKVQKVTLIPEVDEHEILRYVNALENHSTHPVATAIHEYAGKVDEEIEFKNIEEIPGLGMKAEIEGKAIYVGNLKLMDKFRILYPPELTSLLETVVAIGIDNKFVGYISISDPIKKDARETISQLKAMKIVPTMLSGDKTSVVKSVADHLGIENAYGDLLPEDKIQKVQEIKNRGKSVAFVGDGLNDAPVIALSDVGIAMGGIGSDATIETADVVIQDDKLSKIPLTIKIGKKTKRIVWQNITLAFLVKAAVLILGAGGLATMWEAVFADVGVALLAILNAIRIQRMSFK